MATNRPFPRLSPQDRQAVVDTILNGGFGAVHAVLFIARQDRECAALIKFLHERYDFTDIPADELIDIVFAVAYEAATLAINNPADRQ